MSASDALSTQDTSGASHLRSAWDAPGDSRVARPHGLVVSTAVRSLLDGPPLEARVVARFARACYLDVEAASGRSAGRPSRLFGLVAPGGVALPASVVVIDDGRSWLPDVDPTRVVVGGGGLRIGAERYVVRRWWDPRPSCPAVTVDLLTTQLAALDAALAGSAPLDAALAAPWTELGDALLADDDARASTAADALLGRGPGLTPTGDDLLAGLLGAAGHLAAAIAPAAPGPDGGVRAAVLDERRRRVEALGRHVLARAGDRTTAVSAGLLASAVDGQLAAPFVRLVQALTGRGAFGPALDRALAVGSSSGRDLALGVLAAGRLVTAPTSNAGDRREMIGGTR